VTALALELTVQGDSSIAGALSSAMSANRLRHLEDDTARRSTRKASGSNQLGRGRRGGRQPMIGKKKPVTVKRRHARSKRVMPQGRLAGAFLPMDKGGRWARLPDDPQYLERIYDNGPWRGRLLRDYGFERYGVLHVTPSFSFCVDQNDYTIPSYQDAMQGKELEIRRWVRRGGTLWVQNEHSPVGGASGYSWSCGVATGPFNGYLSTVFGEEMGAKFGDGAYTSGEDREIDWDKRVSTYGGNNAAWTVARSNPAKHSRVVSPVLMQDLFAEIKGGIPLYQNEAGRVHTAYSRVGRGAVVINADSNAAQADLSYRTFGGFPSLYETLLAIGGRRSVFNGNGPSNTDYSDYERYWPQPE